MNSACMERRREYVNLDREQDAVTVAQKSFLYSCKNIDAMFFYGTNV